MAHEEARQLVSKRREHYRVAITGSRGIDNDSIPRRNVRSYERSVIYHGLSHFRRWSWEITEAEKRETRKRNETEINSGDEKRLANGGAKRRDDAVEGVAGRKVKGRAIKSSVL